MRLRGRRAVAGQLPMFAVRRSYRARRARLTVTDAGEAVVTLPAAAPSTLAAELVARHADWLERHQQRIGAEQRALNRRPRLERGRELNLRGVPLPVRVERVGIDEWPYVCIERRSPRTIVVRMPRDSTETVSAVLERWLRSEARRDVTAAVARRAAEMGLRPKRVTIRDQRTRWGSASTRGTLSFSWRLVLCPPAVLDYVVVHELAHLRYGGHGPRFWSLVREHAPRADRHRAWLDEQHRALHAALD